MKKLPLLLLLLCLSTFVSQAATISGVVHSTATCAPVSGQKVIVKDSFSLWQDSSITNSAGQYSITIPATVANPSSLFLETNACGAIYRNMGQYSGGDVVINMIICGTATILPGQVLLGTTAATGPSKVWLIRRDVAPITFDTSLVAVDSTYTFGQGYFNIWLPCVPSGTFLLKGALMPAHPGYSSYIPSYHDSSLNWNGATLLTSAAFSGFSSTKIYLKAGVNPGGPGFIGGSVLLGANKGTAVGDPLAGRTLLLTNAITGKAVGYTRSNASGQFQFSGLAYGTYHIFGDAWGKKNPILSITLSASSPNVSNVIFEENDKKFEGHIGNLSTGAIPALSGLSIYPNPATDFVSVKGLATINGNKTITLSNIAGTVISRQLVTTGDARVATAALAAGVYLLQVQTEAGNATFKVVK